MQQHQIASREQWIAARKIHLAHEKELSQARERLAEERRALPWVKVDKSYLFDGPNGKVTLGDLFHGPSATRRPACDVRARLGGRLQELLVLG